MRTSALPMFLLTVGCAAAPAAPLNVGTNATEAGAARGDAGAVHNQPADAKSGGVGDAVAEVAQALVPSLNRVADVTDGAESAAGADVVATDATANNATDVAVMDTKADAPSGAPAADAKLVDIAAADVAKADGLANAGAVDAPLADVVAADNTIAAADQDAQPAWQPPASGDLNDGGLTNVSKDLGALLEGGKLAKACAQWHATQGKGTQQQKLLCGKAMFFYESFGTYGVPQAMVDFMVQDLPKSVGPGMAAFGMFADPSSAKKTPLGLAPGANLPNTTVATYTFTCASCHFGKLNDGRYVVGLANHDYDYGRQILALNLFAKLATGLESPAKHAPKAVAAVQPLVDEYKSKPELMLKFGMAMLQLVGALGSIPPFSVANEAAYASWKPGTQDFLMAPVVIDDSVHTVSKIISLFSLPTAADIQGSQMKHALLGWTGVSASLPNFLRGFAALGAGDAGWPQEKLEPLAAYLQTLKAPPNPQPAAAGQVAQGGKLFVTKGCTNCHGGPAFSGTKAYSYVEIGSDAAMAAWLDPDLDGVPMANPILMPGDDITNGIKSPRLRGVWAAKRLLHNGSVNSLEQLFCLGSARPTVVAQPFGDGGHMMTCQGLTDPEKTQLIAYLRSL